MNERNNNMENLNEMTMKLFIKKIRNSDVAKSLIPMQTTSGLPVISLRKGEICVTIPYYKVTLKPNDKTLVYPLSYSITALWPNGKIIDYKNFKYIPGMKHIDFSVPVGTFRHEAVKKLNELEYGTLRSELLSCYDGFIHSIKENKQYENTARMKELINIIMEPYQKPMYLIVGSKFFKGFISL
jgi:hypothetical protein